MLWCRWNCCWTLIFIHSWKREREKKKAKVSNVCSSHRGNKEAQICVCGHDLHADWILTTFYQWHISSSPNWQKEIFKQFLTFCCTLFMRKAAGIISSTLIEDHRNSPVLVLTPIRKFLFPALQLKRSSGRWTVNNLEVVSKKSTKPLNSGFIRKHTCL